MSVCFDNYQRSFQKSIQSFGKSSIFHQCTSFIGKMNATPDVINGTLISSPLGRVFWIVSCVRINRYRVMLGGVPNTTTDVLLLPTELRREVVLMQRCALCWPCISWDIIFTPGADRSAEIDYVNPYIPSPLRANIGVHVQLNDYIFLSRDNPCDLSVVPSSMGFTSLKTTQYQDMVVFADIAKQIQKTYNTIKDEHKRSDHFAEMMEQTSMLREIRCYFQRISHTIERERIRLSN